MRGRISKEEKLALERRKLLSRKIASVVCSLYDDEFENNLDSILCSIPFVNLRPDFLHEDFIVVRILADVRGPVTEDRLHAIEEELEKFYQSHRQNIDIETLYRLEMEAIQAIEDFNAEMMYLKRMSETEPFSSYMVEYKMIMASKSPLSKADKNVAMHFSSKLRELHSTGKRNRLIQLDDDGSPKDCPNPDW
ncbi:hypothetical protein [Flaviaesturariibacter amylovorans]|uniref:Uncharacterized protein n=1 Tax=Flaviaesturariibacter amylovorans TaxID=1084520 RepID=A0ABP8HI09_9BACT